VVESTANLTDLVFYQWIIGSVVTRRTAISCYSVITIYYKQGTCKVFGTMSKASYCEISRYFGVDNVTNSSTITCE